MKLAPINRYRGMTKVESDYAASGMSDSEFAASMSTPDVKYTTAMIREWRRMLNIPNNVTSAPVLVGELQEEVALMKRIIAEALPYVQVAGNYIQQTEQVANDHAALVQRMQGVLE